MNKYKKFTISTLAIVFVFLLYNIIIWKLFNEKIMTGDGDLARIGYIHGYQIPRINVDDLPRKHFEQEEYTGQHVDVLTVGDSFTNGGGWGKNRYYQDYIASINMSSVMNIEPYNDIGILHLVATLLNNGYLDTVKPRAIIISSSEKLCIERFASMVDFNINIPMDSLRKMKRKGYRRFDTDLLPESPKLQFGYINDGNFKFSLFALLRLFNERAYFSKVYKFKMSKQLFEVEKKGDTLLVYKGDIHTIPKATQPAVAKLNDNFNLLADKLAAKGIKLYFMPCVDKYNLYSEFIINNRYQMSSFFETLQALPKRYTLIDTKSILQQEVRSGAKDVFYADDSHWTWRASEKIFTSVKFQ